MEEASKEEKIEIVDIPPEISQKEIWDLYARENVEEVVDVTKDVGTVQGWFNEAREVTNFEGLEKLSKRVLETPKMTAGTLPYAYASIGLASLKIAFLSKHGALDANQWKEVIEIFTNAAVDGGS